MDDIPLPDGCRDQWTWNEQECSNQVRLCDYYGVATRVAYFHPDWASGTAAVRGTRELNNERHYWELEVSDRVFGTSMMFGVGTKSARLHSDKFLNLLGEDRNSWGLSHKGLAWHGGDYYRYTERFRQNVATVIGILFDGIEGTLTYYKDGECLGVAFTNLHRVKEPIYAMVSSTACKTQISLAYMKRDFANLQDRCRAVIMDKIKSKDVVDELCLPQRIKTYLSNGIYKIHEPVEPYLESTFMLL